MRPRTMLPLLAVAIAGLHAADAGARRTATKSESRAMWRVVDPDSHCTQRRGKISTVRSSKWRYGVVTIADAKCGNGSFVLRRAKSGGRWRQRLAGSDFGNPSGCASDIKRVPLSVLRDLLAAPELCKT